MSYNITINGHMDHASAEEAKQAEAKAIEEAKALVAKLEGVATATGSFQHHGFVELRQVAQ